MASHQAFSQLLGSGFIPSPPVKGSAAIPPLAKDYEVDESIGRESDFLPHRFTSKETLTLLLLLHMIHLAFLLSHRELHKTDPTATHSHQFYLYERS